MRQDDSSMKREERRYRGVFSSSICDMFRDHSRTDACALACCGIFLHERNRFMLLGEKPKPWKDRISGTEVALLLLGTLLVKEGLQMHLVRSAAIVGVCWASWRLWKFQQVRRDFRVDLALYTYRKERSASNIHFRGSDHETDPLHLLQEDEADFLREHKAEIFGQPYCCGFISEDLDVVNLDEGSNDEGDISSNDDDNEPVVDTRDFGSKFWRFLASIHCSACPGKWFQCLSMCAIAQEHRHLRQILPDQMSWHHDYITFQSWNDYYPQIQRLRDGKDGSWASHVAALSQLSRRLAVGVGILLAVLCLSILQGWNIPLLLGTMTQSIVVLYFVYWQHHRFDISLDAVIKYFSAGAVISTSMSLAYGFLIDQRFSKYLYLVDLADEDGFFGKPQIIQVDSGDSSTLTTLVVPTKVRVGIAIVIAFFWAFVLDAFFDELMIYLSFWMVEHPDLSQDEFDGKKDKKSVQFQQRNGEALAVRSSRHRSVVSRGAATTIAMVSVATGFACINDLQWIFMDPSNAMSSKWATFVIRAMTPILPLAAALQSIGVNRRDLEGDSSTSLFQVLLPAIILHGVWDSLPMAEEEIQYAKEAYNYSDQSDDFTSSPADADEDDFAQLVLPDTIDVLILSPIVIASFVWYIVQSRAQRKRLKVLDLHLDP